MIAPIFDAEIDVTRGGKAALGRQADARFLVELRIDRWPGAITATAAASASQASARRMRGSTDRAAATMPPRGRLHAGPKLKAALAGQPVDLEIVKRTDKQGGFKVIRRRWVIERTFSWLRRNRRLMARYEAIASIAEGLAKLAMISLMLSASRDKAPNHLVNFRARL